MITEKLEKAIKLLREVKAEARPLERFKEKLSSIIEMPERKPRAKKKNGSQEALKPE